MADHLTELQSYHSQCTNCEVSVVRSECWMVVLIVSCISWFIKKLNVIAVLFLRFVSSERSQYEVVAFETKDGIKCLDVRLALYGCTVVVSMWNTLAGTEIWSIFLHFTELFCPKYYVCLLLNRNEEKQKMRVIYAVHSIFFSDRSCITLINN